MIRKRGPVEILRDDRVPCPRPGLNQGVIKSLNRINPINCVDAIVVKTARSNMAAPTAIRTVVQGGVREWKTDLRIGKDRNSVGTNPGKFTGREDVAHCVNGSLHESYPRM